MLDPAEPAPSVRAHVHRLREQTQLRHLCLLWSSPGESPAAPGSPMHPAAETGREGHKESTAAAEWQNLFGRPPCQPHVRREAQIFAGAGVKYVSFSMTYLP